MWSNVKNILQKTLSFRLIGIATFLYLLWSVKDNADWFQLISSMNPAIWLAIIPIHLLQWVLRVHRCSILLRDSHTYLRFGQVFVVTASGFFFGCLSPGRLGEIAKVKFLMNVGYSFRKAFLAYLIERLTDVFGLLFFVGLGILQCTSLFPISLSAATVLPFFFLIPMVIWAVIRYKLFTAAVRLLPKKVISLLQDESEFVKQSLRAIPTHDWIIITFHSIMIWGLNCCMIYWLFNVLHPFPFFYGVAFIAFGSLAGLIPLSIYGIGIREWSLVPLFTWYGFSAADSQVAAVLLGMMYLVLLLYHIVLGLLCWMSPAMRFFLTKPQPVQSPSAIHRKGAGG